MFIVLGERGMVQPNKKHLLSHTCSGEVAPSNVITWLRLAIEQAIVISYRLISSNIYQNYLVVAQL